MGDLVSLLSNDGGSVPVNIAALVVFLASLSASIYWFRKAFESYKQRIDKEIDSLRKEVALQAKENHEIKEKVVEMHVDIKWIKDALMKRP